MVSTSDFDSGSFGSSPDRKTNGGFSLFGKALDCESKEQGSNPEITLNAEVLELVDIVVLETAAFN